MALVFPLLLAIALAEPLLLDFQSRETWTQPRLQRRAAAEARVYNAQSSLMYLVDVTVGTPPQALKLQLDTGSSDVWIPYVAAPPCRAKRCIEGSFNPQRSKSFSVLDTNSFRIKYVDGTHIGGDYISDSFGIAGLSISNMTMGLATAANEQDSSAQFEGIVGLGFEHGEAAYAQKGVTYPNLISKLKSQGIISSRSYSLWLNDKSNGRGSILFGGIDTERYHDPLVALPIQPDTRTRTVMSFTVALDSFTVKDANNSLTYSRTNLSLPVILDSGTTITYLPDPIAHDLYAGVGAVVSDEYGVVVPCSIQHVPATLNFGFGNAGGPIISASVGQFVLPFPPELPKVAFLSTGDEACRWGLQAAGGRPLLFGDTFLRAAYVVYSIDSKHVAVANARFNVSAEKSNVVQIDGAQLPADVVSSTASGGAAFTAPAGDASSGVYPPAAVTFGSGAPADITTRPTGTWNLGTPTATKPPEMTGRGKGGNGKGKGEGERRSAAVRGRPCLVLLVGVVAVVVLRGWI